jgi:short-subunit dehydrogenase
VNFLKSIVLCKLNLSVCSKRVLCTNVEICVCLILFNFSITGHSYSVNPGNKMYNASKQALRVLTEGLRHEIAAAGDGHIKVSVSISSKRCNVIHGFKTNVLVERTNKGYI